MDLFNITFKAVSPYLFGVLKLAFGFTLFSSSVKIIRSKGGNGSMGSGNQFNTLTTAFTGYLLGRGIPIIIQMTDQICNDILKNMR